MFSTIRKLGALRQASKPGPFLAAMSEAKYITISGGPPPFDNLTVRLNKISLQLTQKQKIKNTTRTLTTLPASSLFSENENEEFMVSYRSLSRDLAAYSSKYNLKLADKRFAKALDYNVPRGKLIRGLITASTYTQLADKSHLTPENIRLSHYLGWCVEIFHSSLLIIDDILDESVTRRGHPCWYMVENVGLTAINDSVMIESSIFYILRKYFSHTDYYVRLLDLFNETFFVTTLGESLDLQMCKEDVSSFTLENHKTTAVNKTSYYSLYLPFALGMQLAGFTDEEAYRQAKTILLEIGHFWQVRDDFFDCFGDPVVTGKIGTDIQDKKCSWLAIVCMQRASDEQKEIMRECYGNTDPIKVARVKQLYIELGLRSAYVIYEEETYNMIKTLILQTSHNISHQIFFKIMNKIFQRKSKI